VYEIVVLASGGGGNLRAILESENHLRLFKVVKVLSEKECNALRVASDYGIIVEIFDATNKNAYFEALPQSMNLIVLAGFMPIVPEEICSRYSGKIINTHPSLLPKYGGRGMYGVRVQEAVLAGLETSAGCTVHFVSPGIDEGLIIEQLKIPIPPKINAWDLGGLVHDLETVLLPRVITRFALGELP